MDIIIQIIFSTTFFYTVVRVATPLILASMGAVVTSNAGITNIGIEGVMLVSALTGVLASAFGFGPWFGFVVAILTGVLSSLLIGYVSMKLEANSVLTCIVFNTMAIGGTVYFMYSIVHDKGTTMSLVSGRLPQVVIPFICEIPILGEILSNHNIISYLAILSVGVVYLLLYRTPLGLRIRAAGKSPNSLTSVGVDVKKIRYIALGISGVLGGMGGAFMSMGYVTWFSKNMVAGRGFIALAADAMGNSTPIGAMLSALLFAFAEALSYALQITSIPSELVQMIPYLMTIIGLVSFSIKVKSEKKKKYEAVLLQGENNDEENTNNN